LVDAFRYCDRRACLHCHRFTSYLGRVLTRSSRQCSIGTASTSASFDRRHVR
jgi:hypothetical protein